MFRVVAAFAILFSTSLQAQTTEFPGWKEAIEATAQRYRDCVFSAFASQQGSSPETDAEFSFHACLSEEQAFTAAVFSNRYLDAKVGMSGIAGFRLRLKHDLISARRTVRSK